MLLSAFLSFFTMISAEGKNAIRVYETKGNSVTYLLSVQPSVTFSNDELRLKADDVELAYPLSPSVRFEFVEISEESTGIRGAESKPTFKIAADEIVISHVRPYSIVSICNMSGMVVKSARADSEGRLIINALNLPKDIYIIKTEQIAFKIFVK